MAVRTILVCLVLGLASGADGGFVAPDLRKTLLHRDRVPLDPDRMRQLSSQLVVLATRAGEDRAPLLRARAQLLALADGLDPANPAIRAALRGWESGSPPPAPAPEALQRAEATVWPLLAWLREEDAGSEGQRLAALLMDPLHQFHPRHPGLEGRDPDGEATRWAGVVPPLERFQAPDPAVPSPTADSPSPVSPAPQPEPAEPPVPEPAAPVIPLRQNALRAPLFVFGEGYRLGAEVVSLQLQINESEQAGPLTYSLNPSFNAPELDLAREQTAAALRSVWTTLPERNFAVLSTDERRYAQRSGSLIAGPATLLLHACLAGKPLREDLCFLGEILPDGSIRKPAEAWRLLTALRSGPGGRLLVPPDLRNELAALVVLEQAGFFLKYEVLEVSSLDTALALGARGDDPAGLHEAAATFAEVREASRGRGVGQFVALDSVRERLTAVQAAAPFHLSAEMLLLQASGTDRPRFLTRELLARELERALDPLHALVAGDQAALNPTTTLDAWKAVREDLDQLQKFVDITDRPLFREAFDLANSLRTLSRDLKGGRDEDGELRPAPRRLWKEIGRSHQDFLTTVATATGDPPPLRQTPPTD